MAVHLVPAGATLRTFGLIAVVIFLVSGPTHAEAAFPGENGALAYTGFNSAAGTYQTCTRTADGTGQHCFSLGGDNWVRWSPNGTRLALGSSDSIYTVDPDGTDAIPLTSTDEGSSFSPAWSPDGTKIVFDREPDIESTLDIFVMNADGSGQQLLFDAAEDTGPSWSPDGKKIAFTTYFGGSSSIYVMNANGTGATSLNHRGIDPNWSPDGAWIAFASDVDGSDDIYKMRPDGTDVTPLTNDDATVRNASPAWSPDGTKVAFTSNATSLPRPFPGRVDVVDSDGTGRDTMFATSTDEFLSSVDWQPVLRSYPRPKSATPLRVPLVPAFAPCASPNRTHGAPLSFPSCAPPVTQSSNLTVSRGELGARTIGAVILRVLAGTPGPPDDADLKIGVSLTNVMRASDGSDYTGEVRLELPLRLTDRLNKPSPGGFGFGTVTDTSFFATVPCSATAETALGASCTLSTTADTLLPGSAREGTRAIWALDQVRLHDGGTDEDADTPGDNELFAAQGLFVP